MVLVCPFIMNMYHRLLLHVIVYYNIHKITGKYRFQEKATWISVVTGYRNTMYIYQIHYKNMSNMHTSAVGWDTVQFVVRHTVLCLKA